MIPFLYIHTVQGVPKKSPFNNNRVTSKGNFFDTLHKRWSGNSLEFQYKSYFCSGFCRNMVLSRHVLVVFSTKLTNSKRFRNVGHQLPEQLWPARPGHAGVVVCQARPGVVACLNLQNYLKLRCQKFLTDPNNWKIRELTLVDLAKAQYRQYIRDDDYIFA